MAQSSLDELCEEIAARINDEVPTFGGYDVRADAGSLGAIYIALREAQHELETGEQLADRVAPILDDELENRDLDYAISLGAGDEDLLLQVEVRKEEG